MYFDSFAQLNLFENQQQEQPKQHLSNFIIQPDFFSPELKGLLYLLLNKKSCRDNTKFAVTKKNDYEC